MLGASCDITGCFIGRYLWYAQLYKMVMPDEPTMMSLAIISKGYSRPSFFLCMWANLCGTHQIVSGMHMHKISAEQRRGTRSISLWISINPTLSAAELERSFGRTYLGHGEREQNGQFDQNFHCTRRSPTIWRKIDQTAQAHQQPADQVQREPRKRPRACSHFASGGTCRLTWRAIVFRHVGQV